MVIKPPPFLLAAGLLFWGWYTGFMIAAVIMATTVESARFFRLRWELSRRDFERIADLCTIVFVGALVFQFAQNRHFPDALVSVLVWLPMLFFALILAQRYSTEGRIPLSALFWSLRRRSRSNQGAENSGRDDPGADNPGVENPSVENPGVKNPGVENVGVDRRGEAMPLDYAYFCLSLLAASSANPRTPWFFAGLSALGLYALWPAAPKRSTRRTWALAFVTAIGLAFALQAGLLRAQVSLEDLVFEWLAHRWRPPADPYRTRTAIGDIGELKASDRIVLRVDAGGGSAPQRLRAAAYTAYAGGTWTAPGQVFTPITGVDQTWDIAPGAGASVRLSIWLENNRALLALPLGTFRLESLNVASAQRNGLGAVRVSEGPDMLVFDARFDAQHSLDAAPDPTDLSLPSSVRSTLDMVATEIGLPEHDPRAKLQAIAGFFDSRFAYSLALSARGGTPRSLKQFLLEDRRGHCEYFATATVLLLRYAGIPARYATGFAVQEWSTLEHQYVVRMRHAHAWALAWVDGRWQELDTTPAVWAQDEQEAASPLQPLYDLLSLLNYRIALWQHADPEGSGQGAIMLGLAAVLIMYLAWRIWRRRRVRAPAGTARAAFGTQAVADPRIVALLEALARLGYVRPPGAPLLRWARELPLADAEAQRLLELAVLSYYQTRFDPKGAEREKERAFDQHVRALISRLLDGPGIRAVNTL